MDGDFIAKLKERYGQKIHQVVFQRAIHLAKNEVELFDILDTIPQDAPAMVWDGNNRRIVPVKLWTDFLNKTESV